MSNPPIKDVASEKDKPFILALIGSGVTIVTGVLAAVKVSFVDPIQAMDIFKSTLTLTVMAWTYYFAKKD
jgi:hypothetical protein